jgi:hypothetical protein
MGLQLTTERLRLLQQSVGRRAEFEIQDLHREDGCPAGTRVLFPLAGRAHAPGYGAGTPATIIPKKIRRQILEQTNAVEIELGRSATVEEAKSLHDAIGRLAADLEGVDRVLCRLFLRVGACAFSTLVDLTALNL